MVCPNCGTNNPEGSDHCFNCGGNVDPTPEILDSLDPAKVTAGHRALAAEISTWVGDAFERAKNAKIIEAAFDDHPQTASESDNLDQLVAPERLAELFADRPAFTPAQFANLLKNNPRPPGRTHEQALGVWRSLDNLAIAVAAWAIYRDWGKLSRIVMVDEVVAADVSAFVGCENGREMLAFFGRYLNRILGKPENVIIGNETCDNLFDPISAGAVCGQFVAICISAKGILQRCRPDWSCPQPPQPTGMNSQQLRELLTSLRADHELLNWSSGKSFIEFWRGCERGDWLLWLCGKMVNVPGWPRRRDLVLAACACAERVLHFYETGRTGKSDARAAVETARAWATAGASLEQVKETVQALRMVLMFNLPMRASNAAVAAHDAAAAAIATYDDTTAANAVRAAVAAEIGMLIFNRAKIHSQFARLVRDCLPIGDSGASVSTGIS